MSDLLLFASVGAGVVLVMVVLVAASVALIVHAHEVRELKANADRHVEIRRDLDDFRRLVMTAINGRAAVEQDVQNLKIKVKDIDQRVSALEGL